MDEVDRILAAWSAEAPELDVTPMAVLSRVSRLARHLDLARRDTFAAHGLEVWEFDVLAALSREGVPYELSPGELIHQTLSTSGTMTNRIDRLERAGLVVRSPSPGDRRAVLVTLTPSGKQRVDDALISLLECERRILAPLDEGAAQALGDLLRPLLLPFETD